MIIRFLLGLFKKKPSKTKRDPNAPDDTKIAVKKDKSDSSWPWKVYATSKNSKPAQKLLTRHKTKKGAQIAATAFRHDVQGISGKIKMYDRYK